jgi:hypothetical protein
VKKSTSCVWSTTCQGHVCTVNKHIYSQQIIKNVCTVKMWSRIYQSAQKIFENTVICMSSNWYKYVYTLKKYLHTLSTNGKEYLCRGELSRIFLHCQQKIVGHDVCIVNKCLENVYSFNKLSRKCLLCLQIIRNLSTLPTDCQR